MTKKPSYRFVGFEDEWKEVKLGEVAEIVGGGTPSTSVPDYWDGDIDWYSPVEIGTKIFVNSSQRKITQQGLAKSSAKMLPIGTILFTSRAGIGSTAILAKEGCTNQGFQSIVPNQELLDNYFIFSLSHELKRYGEVTGAGSTFVEVSGKQMAKMLISLPSLPEQTAIGSFFQDIDQLISLQQRKLEVLKEQKKTYLKLLFPAKGQIKPALRFAGFEDEWKEVKLGEVTDRYDNLRVPVSANERVSGDTPYYGANGIQDYVDGYTHDGEYILIAEDGASDLKDYPVQYVNGKVWVNNHAHVIQGKKDLINNIFLLFAVKQINIEPFLVGGGRAKLNSDIMMKLPLHLPTLPEQEAIGALFQDLDKAIVKQEEKVNQLKESKQTLLRKMFI